MKKAYALATLALSSAAIAARVQELRCNLDAEGLPIAGFPYLPAILLLSAAVFILLGRRAPTHDALVGDFEDIFDLDNALALTGIVLGAFLLIASAALQFVFGTPTRLTLILAVFLACSGAVYLYAVATLRSGSGFVPVALLLPVCYAAVEIILAFRTLSADPVLLHFYPALLALAALCLALLYLSAFGFRSGSPRLFLAVAGLAQVLLAVRGAEAVRSGNLSGIAFAAGFYVILFAFCACANFDD